MRLDRLLIIFIFLSVILRYLWGYLGWAGEALTVMLVFVFMLILLLVYYREINDKYYKIVTFYLMIFIIGLGMHALDVKGKGILLFIGSLSFFLFPAYFIYKMVNDRAHKKILTRLLFGILLIAQTFVYLFMGTDHLITIAHALTYPLILVGLAILFGKESGKEIDQDEKKILTFIIIVSILSTIGVTFKEVFYSSIWI